MTRSLDTDLQTSLGQNPATFAYLLEMRFGSGTVYVTTASQDIEYGGQTYEAVGGLLEFPEGVSDAMEERSAGLPVRLSGVDQSILALILEEEYIGRLLILSYAHLDPSTGSVVDVPVEMFRGFMNDRFELVEVRDDKGNGTVTIATRVTSRLAELTKQRGIRCNLTSHRAVTGFTDETFFQNTPSIASAKVYWGQKLPAGQTVPDGPSYVPPWYG